MYNFIMNSEKTRDYSIDILRGSAIIFMIITHVNALFSASTEPFLNTLTFWGATVCFSIFLFCFAYIYGMKISQGNFYPTLTVKKTIKLIGAYYLTAISAQFFLTKALSLKTIGDIMTFQLLPEFTEFIVAFILFSLLLILCYKLFAKLLKAPLLFLVIALIVYAIANQLYSTQTNLPEFALNIKALLVGHGDIHAFGIASYFPIFTVGLIWGSLTNSTGTTKRWLALITLLSSTAFFVITATTGISTWNRWPPSPKFFTYGLIYISLIVLLYPYIEKLEIKSKIVGYISTMLKFLSKNSLLYFVLNVIIILGAYWMLNYPKFDTLGVIVANFVAFGVISTFIYVIKTKN